MSELPDGWTIQALGELCDLENGDRGKNYPSKSVFVEEGVPFINAGHLNSGRVDLSGMTFIPEERFEILRGGKIRNGDLLFCLRGSLGKSALITNLDKGAVASSLVIVRPRGAVTPQFLAHYFDAPIAKRMISLYDNGSAQPNLSGADLKKFEVPLPPLPEQRRIVARIEELFSRLDAGVAALRHAKSQLQRYRQSVLAAAVNGELTREWREQHPETEPAVELLERILEQRREQWNGRGKYREPVAPTADHDLPENWVPATSDQLVHFVTSGSRGWAEYYSEKGAIFLRIGNLEHEDIALDLADIQRVTPPEGAEGSRTRVQTNDILISITADVGMVALVDTDIGEAYINQHVALARPSDEVNPRFLAWLLASKPTKAQWKLLQRGATKVGLGLDDIRAVQIGLPPLAEQHEIVAQVEARTIAIDHLEAELDTQIIRANQLRLSILAAAFTGDLNYERN